MKKPMVIAIGMLCFLVSHYVNANTFTFLGTGLSIDIPSYLMPTAVGSALIDESGETTIAFAGGIYTTNLETDSAWRTVYKNNPERIKTKYIEGNLYKRTRRNDGGKWDGWFLSVRRGEKYMIVIATYTGTSQEKFDKIRELLLSIRWDDTQIKTEEAMGISLTPKGLRVVPGVFGMLTYNKEGNLRSVGPKIQVQLMPLPPNKVANIVPANCAAVFATRFGGAAYEGPKFNKRNNLELCEAWSNKTSKEIRYVSLVRTGEGGLLMIAGISSPEEFKEFLPKVRAAVHEVVLLRTKTP